MKTLLVILVLFFKLFTINANEYNAKVILHYKNIDSSYFAYIIDEDKLVFYDSIFSQKDSFLLYLKEPIYCNYIAKHDTSKMFLFVIDTGRLEVFIDALDVRNATILNSPLTMDLYASRRKTDSIENSVYTKEVILLLKKLKDINPLNHQKDSIFNIYDSKCKELYKLRYKESFNKLNSFSTLRFVADFLNEIIEVQKEATFTKKQLKKLFNKLDKSMKEYPTYQRCETMFKQKVPERPVINEPLYK